MKPKLTSSMGSKKLGIRSEVIYTLNTMDFKYVRGGVIPKSKLAGACPSDPASDTCPTNTVVNSQKAAGCG